MEPTQLILPAVATFALGTALLVPLRDDRRGRRATLGGAAAPLRPQFGIHRADRTDGATDDTRACSDARSPSTGASHASDSLPNKSPLTDTNEPSTLTANTAGDASAFAVASSDRERFFPWLVRLGVRIFGIGERSASGTAFDADAPTPDASAPETSVERSFAAELASLLDVATDRHSVDAHVAVDEREERDRERDVDRDVSEHVRDAKPEPDEKTSPRLASVANVTPPDELAPIAKSPASFESSDRAAPSLSISKRAAGLPERVVPITRLPLRPHGLTITWTRDLSRPECDRPGPIDANERRELLERLRYESNEVAFATLERAYHEEEGAARVLALRVLLERHARAARAVFVDALHTGTDDERALAVDGLAAGENRDALPAAFSDRVEAIAARAALEYVGFADRATYRMALSPFVDAARFDALLVLLAGVVE